jgi:hypothetical protein
MTALLLTTIEARPASPATIPETTSLAELQRIKQAWLQAARDLGYHENIWEVAFWLGTPVKQRGGWECKVWQSGNVAIIASEYPVRFLLERNTSLLKRSYTVWLTNPQVDSNRQNPHPNIVDDIVFNSYPVARWAWLMAGSELQEIEEELLFIPGRWFNPILTEIVHAHQAAQQNGMDASEFERRKLLAQLLIGMEI